MSPGDTAVTPIKAVNGRDDAGLGTICQLVPFQCSISAPTGVNGMTMRGLYSAPTAQASPGDRAAMPKACTPLVTGAGEVAIGVMSQWPACQCSANPTLGSVVRSAPSDQPSVRESNAVVESYQPRDEGKEPSGICALAGATERPSHRSIQGR